jgi:hypothetical protein
MKKFLLKLWSNRAFRTFLQGFIGVFAGVQLFDLKDMNVLKTLVISGIMAGISAVMSLNTGEEKFVRTNTEETIPATEELQEEE